MENNNLTEREKLYLSIIKTKHGVLYLQSAPGMAKSAILNSIANKMGWQYIDLRLSQLDPIAVGMFPSISTTEDGMKVLDFTVPKWAILANERPTLINFDELNRAALDTLKAAMQLFNERTIGTSFKFNDNVYMAATGNLGSEEDDTDVTTLDSAMHGRLIHMKHNLNYKEWLKWGDKILHPLIKMYIEEYPNYLYCKTKDDAYASPRTWHFLSEYLMTNYGSEITTESLSEVSSVLEAYIGKSQASKFLAFCNKVLSISLKDILEMSKDTLSALESYSAKDKGDILILSSIIYQLSNLNEDMICSFTEQECNNINKFISLCSNEQAASLLAHFTSDKFNISSNTKLKHNVSIMLKGLKDVLVKLVNSN